MVDQPVPDRVTDRRAKVPRSAAVAGPYGHPFHPILVTVPIGAWVASLVFDIGSRVAGQNDFLARGSLWLIGIGLIGAVVAGVAGIFDLFSIPSGTPAFRTGLLHMSINFAVIAMYFVNWIWRNSLSDKDTVPSGPLVWSIFSLALLGLSGYLGGKLAFRYGVRVADEETQAEGFRDKDPQL
ncbi:MAG TPA: DUF2231 domain-containing protein [Kribbella sp.]